jgi:hypothetical protein
MDFGRTLFLIYGLLLPRFAVDDKKNWPFSIDFAVALVAIQPNFFN